MCAYDIVDLLFLKIYCKKKYAQHVQGQAITLFP